MRSVNGDVVLAEFTRPFNEGDVTCFRPLYHRAVVSLRQFPTHATADATFDAWYVYETAARHDGIGAVPLNAHSKTVFDPDGTPRCEQGLRMVPRFFSKIWYYIKSEVNANTIAQVHRNLYESEIWYHRRMNY
jgi:hypothetical protein